MPRRRRPIRPPFQRDRGGISVNLSADERHLVRRLLGEVRELLTQSPDSSDVSGNVSGADPKMVRLFPPAYTDDDDASAEFSRLMRDELVTSRLAAIDRADEFLADEQRTTVTSDELDAFAMSLNGVRLVLGTLLDVGEDDDSDDVSADDPRAAQFGLYNFLSWLVDSAVSALMSES